MIRIGDVYTYLLKDNMGTGIRECYRPFIVVEVEKKFVFAVPLTTNVRNYRHRRRVYSTLTVNGVTKDVCILADFLIKIPKQGLERKIAHVSPRLVEKIVLTNEGKFIEDAQKTQESVEEIVVTDKDEMMRYLIENNELLKDNVSEKNKWCERGISFILGVVASVIASYIYQLL